MNINELQNLTLQYRATLLPRLFEHCQGLVQSGPFAGLKLLPEVCWGDGDTGSKLLGLYEDELHPYIERIHSADLVVNVGSAEGYYAVGMARRLGCRTIAVDSMPQARTITEHTALVNGVAVETSDAVHTGQLEWILMGAQSPVIVMDCEGAESDLLDPVTVPSLARCRIIVESHDCFVPGITQTLLARFSGTHHCETIPAAGKNPWKFDFLKKNWDLEKLILVNELRPEAATWIWMEPQ